MRQALTTLVLVVAGAWIGICAVAVHALIWGLPLGLAASVAAVLALPAGWRRTGFTLGWLSVLAAAVTGRPEGDWAIVADWSGYLFLASGLVLLVIAVATLPRRAPKSRNQPSPT